jgi:dihydroorotate dehydrogenase
VVSFAERVALTLLHRLDPERAHGLSLAALRLHLPNLPCVVATPRLATTVAGLALENPVGLAAGYDKNAVALAPLMRSGFGFLEVGAATPRPQIGNPKPRLYRLTEDRAAINRFGFNNEGAPSICARLALRPKSRVPVGINLGTNKDSADCAADFATVNVSSPNTEKLRDLQGRAALTSLLSGVMGVQASLSRPVPIFLKIAPDLTDDDLAEITEVALAAGIAGIIATNTTLSRDGLKSADKSQNGGLSGAPLFERSTRILAKLSQLTDGKLPLIGVGGISTADQAFQKIRAGASAVQLYTAMVYEGLSVAEKVARGLDSLLEKGGYSAVADAVGTDRARWL